MNIKKRCGFGLLITVLVVLLPSVSISQKYEAKPPVPVVSIKEFANMMVEKDTANVTSNIASSIISTDIQSQTTTTFQSVRIANGMLKNIPHPWSPNNNPIWVVNANGTTSYLGVRLFGTNVQMDLEGIYLSINPDYAVSFHLDHIRDRIVYSQKSGNWIKAYGNNLENYNPGHYNFFNPKGMAVDINDTIFVADSDNRKIVKLVYNRGSASISLVTSFTISGITHPIDIAIDQSGSLADNPSNDIIWVLDDFANQMVDIHRSGNVVQHK